MSNANIVQLFTPTCSAEHLDALCQVEKLAWSSPGENIEANPDKILARLNSYRNGVSLAMAGDKPAGSQFSFRFDWDGDLASLTTWDEMTSCGWTDRVHNPKGKTGFLVGVGVAPEFRGKKFDSNWRSAPNTRRISGLLIGFTLQKLFYDGVEQVVACARIPLYHTRPDLDVKSYCCLHREDGTLYDPVLRFHKRLYAEIIKPVEYAMEDAESLNAGCFVLYTPMARRI